MPGPITTSETLVNTATTGDQWDPTLTLLSDGGWVVVWMGRVAIGSETGVFAQRYDADGTPIGGEFQVNSASVDQWEGGPSVAALPDGGWLVTWCATSPHGGPSPASAIVYAQRYDSAGTPAGEVQVNAPDGYISILHPDVAVLADGGWVIVWHSQHSGPDADEDVYAQRYDSTGALVGLEFQVNGTAANVQHLPSVTGLNDGGWIVTWMSQGQDGSGWGVYAQRYNADGSTAGGETLVTATTAGDQREPHLATLDDGGWVITWSSSGLDGSGHGIYAQRYDSAGAPVGGEFQVNTTTANDQLYATVEALPGGGWAVCWLSIEPGSDPYGGRIGSIYLQRYDEAGAPVGGETLVGTASEGSFSNLSTRLASLSDGSLVVTWGQYGTDGSGYGIYARTFDAPVNVIDGTEGDDSIVGTPDNDLINALGGDDEVYGLAGDDEVHAGNGDDFVQAGPGNDEVYGGEGNDTLQGDAGDAFIGPSGNDVLYGEGGDDSLRGGLGDDELYGGDGNDHFRGNGGVDYFDGGSETGDNVGTGYGDRISFFEVRATQGVVADLRTGIISNDGFGNVETMVGIESLGADTAYVDTLYGDDNRNFLWGSRGDNLYGFGGDDLFNLSAAGHVDGGTGTDLLSLPSMGFLLPDADSDGLAENAPLMTTGWTVNLAVGTLFDGYGNAGTVTGVENIEGSPFDDTIRGDDNNNVLRGLGGDDIVIGNGGDDTVDGGDGSDFLRGDAQNYTGGPFGDDIIIGGAGDDHMRGGPGVDSFDGGTDSGGESIYGGIGDRISFFEMAATAGVVADLRTGIISNDGFGNVETMTGIESLGGDTAYVDTFYANDNPNSLLGGRGDNLYGFGGDDRFSLGAAAAIADGGDGTDVLQVNSAGGWLMPDADSDGVAEIADPATAGWTVNLAAGTLLDGYGNAGIITGVENVDGSALGDSLIGDDNSNVLNGGDGDDLLEGRAGSDTLDGGAGSDTVSYANAVGPVDLDLGGGVAYEYDTDAVTILSTDTLVSIENAIGSAFADALVGSSGDNVLQGLAGNDFLDGRAGDDQIDGGVGFDTANYGGAGSAVTVDLAAGNASGGGGIDTLTGIEAVIGSNFDDLLIGDSGANSLTGRNGNDTLLAGGGDDFMRGGAGDDLMDGGSGFDRVSHYGTNITNGVTVDLRIAGAQNTGHGMDTYVGVEALSGSRFDDTLIGDDDANWLIAADGADSLVGNGGDDLLTVGDGEVGPASGNHSLDGGSGVDTVDVSWSTLGGDGVTLSLALQGAAQDSGHGSLLLSNVENLSGSQYGDALTGDGNANTLSGHGGNDSLVGGAGDDSLYGDGALVADTRASSGGSGPITFFADVTAFDPSAVAGNDTLEGGLGDDFIDGGGGSDTASYEHSAGPVEVNLQSGFADEYDSSGTTILSTDTLANIDNAIGSEFDDALVGSSGDNALEGLGGSDTIIGLQGNDTLDGGDGDDTVQGNQGDDTLFGGAGADTLNGNQGDDIVHGGDGEDRVIGNQGNDSLYGGDGHDFLRGDNADGLTPGNDYIDAGAGFDRVTFYNTNNAVTVSLLLQGVAQDTGQGMDTLLNTEAISGSIFSDTLIGDDADNWFFIGGAGIDHHTVTSDTITGNGGNDLIVAGFGDHNVDGGTGTDTLGFTWVRTEIFGGVTVSLQLQGAAQDTGQGSMTVSGFENLSGSMFDDVFTGDNGANLLAGGAANDILYGGTGNDVLLGDGEVNMDMVNPAGAGPIATFNELDYAAVDFYDSANNVVYLFEGQDLYDVGGNLVPRAELVDEFGDPYSQFTLNGVTYDFYVGFETTSDGVTGNDILDGGDGDDILIAGAGNDSLIGGAGGDSLDGGAGLDTVSYWNAAGPVDLDMSGGVAYEYDTDAVTILSTDTLVSIEYAIGSQFDDALVGNAGDNYLDGAGGNDIVQGRGGNDQVNGGAGNDNLSGDFGIAILTGGGNDLVDGGDGNDAVRGRDGNDTVLGGEGNDFVEGGTGDDLVDGGSGYDRAGFFSMATAGVTVDLNLQGIAQNTGQGWDTLVGIEHLSGSAFNDVLIGDGGDNWILAGLGGGSDTVNGNGGNDLVEVGAGNHTLSGGAGIDTLSLFGNSTDISAAGVTFSLAAQGAAQNSEQGMMNASGFENLSGSLHDDSLTGDDGANILLGDGGTDTLSGGNGNDTLYGDGRMWVDLQSGGGSGAITLFRDSSTIEPPGVAGNDRLIGGRGNDILYGGQGNDVMTGSQGNDIFVIEANAGSDRITDFSNMDTIRFDPASGIDAFSDLTITQVGRDTLITWGTTDSLLLEGVRARSVGTSAFEFGSASAAMSQLSGAESEAGTGIGGEAGGYSASGDYFL